MLEKALIFLLLGSLIVHSNACDCGIESVQSRIYNGKQAKAHNYPWMAYIRTQLTKLSQTGSCGGTLINDYQIVTAAHCVLYPDYKTAIEASNMQVYLGLHSTENLGEGLKVIRVNFEKEYVDNKDGNDIAVLDLAQKIKFTSTIQPICVERSNSESYKKMALITAGWGRKGPVESGFFGSKSPKSKVLLQSEMEYVPFDKCDEMKDKFDDKMGANRIDYNQFYMDICAIDYKHKSTVCRGDSGGPLMYKNNGRWFLAGITSRGWADCGPKNNIPKIFTDINRWKNSYLKNACQPGFFG